MNTDIIVEQLKRWNKAYREGKPEVLDSVYDSLLEELPYDHPYRNTIEPEVLYKGRIKHVKPMLSMQKAKTEKEMDKWKDSVLYTCHHLRINPEEVSIKCTAKLDGIAGRIDGNSLVTRGDGIYGNDIFSAFDKGLITSNINKEALSDGVLGELVVKIDYFKDNLQSFSHPRNFVSGAIMSDTVNSITNKAFNDNAILFQAYSDLPARNIPILDLIDNFREAEELISRSVNYAIDGVIFEVDNDEIKRYMGSNSHHPNWAIALKPKDKSYESTIINIVWQTGRSGKVTPVVMIEPVMIDGVEVKRATAHNARMVETLGLHIGARIKLIRSGSVIPYIIGVV